jgi:hypothetical protein
MVRLVIGTGLTALSFAVTVANAIHGSLVGVIFGGVAIVASVLYMNGADDGR